MLSLLGMPLILLSVPLLSVLLLRSGYASQWTGFGPTEVKEGVQPAKTLWDWLDLLIVPVVLAIGGYFLNSSQNRATQAAAERRTQDEALQAYLDNMSEMLIPSSEQPSLYDEPLLDSLRNVARARTLTVLPRLDDDHKGRVVQFLYESGLIAKGRPVVDLGGADLQRANLGQANLSEADLSEANLSGANLTEANLTRADLSGADLFGANLVLANLSEADLSKADLSKADLRADLSGTNLDGTNLSWADLSWATLRGANPMVLANLTGANLTRADLSWATLSGADLSFADLSEADLSGADLSRGPGGLAVVLVGADLRFANLSGVDLSSVAMAGVNLMSAKGWDEEQLENAYSLHEFEDMMISIMPNGQGHRDWLRNKDRGEDGENSGPS
jgi:uncharacterized protein YjbI with pentapeptide repeats